MSRLPRQARAAEAADPERPNGDEKRRRWRRRRDWGGLVARLLCAVFALVGVVPLAVGGLLRVDKVQHWAAEQTSRLLHDELGLSARYELELSPWPLRIEMADVVVDASDGGTPFLAARRVTARPRIFSLLAGKADLGDLEIEDATIRAVVRDGAIANLDYRLPESPPSDGGSVDLPLSAISVTNADVDVRVDDLRVRSVAIDLDVSIGRPSPDHKPLIDAGVFEIAMRAGQTLIDHRHPTPGKPELQMADEDILCGFDLRARVADDVVVRHFELAGAVDADPALGTRPSCDLPRDDWRHVSLAVEGGEVRLLPGGELHGIDGRLSVRVPAMLVHRLIPLPPVTGWVALDLERAHYDNSLKIPNVEGSIVGDDLSFDGKNIARNLKGSVRIENDRLEVSDLGVDWAGGHATFPQVSLAPFEPGMPVRAKDVVMENVQLEDLLDDLAAHPHAHVGWTLGRVAFDTFTGTLDPLSLSGPIDVDSRDFAVWDRPTTEPVKKRMMGVNAGRISGTFNVTETAIVLGNMTLAAGRSMVRTTVSLGYDERLGIAIYEGSEVDLRDISPVVDIEMSGKASITAEGFGMFGDPQFTGEIGVDDFVFGGFPIGDVVGAKIGFVPLAVVITEGRVKKGRSDVDITSMHIDFDDGDADVVMDAAVDTRRGGLHLADMFRMLNLRTSQARTPGAIPQLSPTWEQVDGLARGTATMSYVLGGHRDRCDSGNMVVRSHMALEDVDLFGVAFDGGDVDFDWLWSDLDGGDQSVVLDVHSAVLRKGDGTIVTKASLRPGAKLHASVVGTGVPIDEFRQFRDAFGITDRESDSQAVRRIRPEASVSFVAALGGELTAIDGSVDVEISPMRIGPDLLPSSHFRVDLQPRPSEQRPVRRTRCDHPVYAGFSPAEWAADEPSGVFSLSGELFAGQVRFQDVQVTQQRANMVSGQLALADVDLGAMANLLPDVAFSASPPSGRLTATLVVDELPVDNPGLAEVRLYIQDAVVQRRRTSVRVRDVREPVLLSGDALRIPTLPLDLQLGSGLKARLVAGGQIDNLSRNPTLAMTVNLAPMDLAKLGVEIPSVDRASGVVTAGLTIEGDLASPSLSGRLELDNGMLRVSGLPIGLDDINVDLRVKEGEIAIRRATARVGTTGRIAISGRIPLRGMDIATADATLIATDIKIPIAEGIKLTADARLHATYVPPSDAAKRSLPNITGRVTLKQFSYTRPISFQLDLDSLTGGGVTRVESYNPEDDTFSFDVAIVSPQPVTVANNLLDMRLDLGPSGVRLSGTDQRFGAQGQLRIVRGSKLFLQGHDFSVRDGTVTFDNPTRIAPKLDVSATTEYRRYAASSPGSTTATTATSTAGGSSASGGRWRINMHAYGDTDSPEVRFSSDPPLSQEDIVLLLQVGMTRAELDRNLSGALAQTVGLEALNAVTGLDQAFEKTVPIIDEFRVGTQYSSRTGRPEPSVTLGKRITDDVRASVTTGLSENREVRSNIEWRLKGGVSVQGSYDNVNEVSNAGIGNIGAGLRWRLEFK
jgi:translocation and assembly module TamB